MQEDHFLVEVDRPRDRRRRCRRAAQGELVFTTLTKEALPLVRYRTGDIALARRAPCACGRTFARMSAVRGRRDDMLIVRGVNLYPSQVEHVLLTVDGVAPHYQLVVKRPAAARRDHRALRAGRRRRRPRRARASECGTALRERIGVGIAVEVLAPGEVPRSEGKAVRVVDRR